VSAEEVTMTEALDAALTERHVDDIVLTPFPVMILGIVGSRSFAYDPEAAMWLPQVHALAAFAVGWLQPSMVVSGGAKGVDRAAKQVGDLIGVKVLEFLPPPGARRWADYKPRNIQIAETVTHLLHIRWAGTRTDGSGWTKRYAEQIGRKTFTVELPHEGAVEWPIW
jgi:hypothetical protein